MGHAIYQTFGCSRIRVEITKSKETIKELNGMNQQDDPVASKVRLLFKIQDKFKRIQSIEAVVHAKNVAREII